LELWRLTKAKGLTLKYRVPSLWPSYISERSTNIFAKEYGIKVRCCGEHVGEFIENLENVLEM
jgi:hypothetical protein